jgi:hypothetical protein
MPELVNNATRRQSTANIWAMPTTSTGVRIARNPRPVAVTTITATPA